MIYIDRNNGVVLACMLYLTITGFASQVRERGSASEYVTIELIRGEASDWLPPFLSVSWGVAGHEKLSRNNRNPIQCFPGK